LLDISDILFYVTIHDIPNDMMNIEKQANTA